MDLAINNGFSTELMSRLPAIAQDELSTWSKHLPLLRVERGLVAACKAVAGELQLSWRIVYRRWSEYQKSQDPLSLLARSRLPRKYWSGGFAELPPAFLEFAGQVAARHQRDKFGAAVRSIVRQWQRWHAGDEAASIPGYETCPPPDDRTGLPRGWSESNLRRQIRTSDYARKLVQIGPKAASCLAPPILTTRVGIEVGQFYLFDDSWNDFRVVARGQCVRLLSFHALDLASGCNILRGHKPALTDEQGIERRLSEREMIFLVVALLTTLGYRPDGCVLVCEKGTATVRDREATLLDQLSAGKILVKTGPAGGGPGISALCTGPGGGNPRWKASLESSFNLLRNRTADLLEFPGQTGSNSRLNLPEGLSRIERDTLAVLKAARGLSPDRLELLRLGLLTSIEAQSQLDAMVELINCRTDHDLEGWRKAGHYVREWRPSPDLTWQSIDSLLAMGTREREAVAALIAGSPVLMRERALSPREVFDAGRSRLVKLPMSAAAILLGGVEGTERPVRNGLLELNCPDLDPDEPVRFGPVRRDGRGTEEPLRDGDKYLVRVNPLAPDLGWLYDAHGGFCGVARNYGRVRRDDPDALQRQFAQKNAWRAGHTEEARRLAAPITRHAIDLAANHAAVFGDRPVTAPERTLADQVRRDGPAAADAILDPQPIGVGQGMEETQTAGEELLAGIL